MLRKDSVLCLDAVLEFKANTAAHRRRRVVDSLLENATVAEACRNATPFARITNIDLRHVSDVFMGRYHGKYGDWAAAELRIKLRALMGKHGVLVFPGQELTPHQQVAVHRAFGYHNPTQRRSDAGFEQVDVGGEWFEQQRAMWRGVCRRTAPDARPVWKEGPPSTGWREEVEFHDEVDEVPRTPATAHRAELPPLRLQGYMCDGIDNQAMFASRLLPVLTSIHALAVAPDRGDCSHFACSRLAIRNLPTQRARQNAARLRVHYLNPELVARREPIVLWRRITRCPPPNEDALIDDWKDGPEASIDGPVHPLVRVHPEREEASVFLGCRHVCYMKAPAKSLDEPALNFDMQDSYEVIRSLLDQSTSAEEAYCHHWQDGDFVIWDNRLAMHAHNEMAREDGHRRMHVVALDGSPLCNSDMQGAWCVASARGHARARPAPGPRIPGLAA